MNLTAQMDFQINQKTETDCPSFSKAFLSNSTEETFAFGQRIASFLKQRQQVALSQVIALRGELGSGKTVLAKGIANGLGIRETITSPTYTIISEYPKTKHHPALYHIDAYRLNGDEDFEQTGGNEILNSYGISIIEWSERIPKSLPDNTIYITIEITGPASRLISCKGLIP